MNIYQCVAVIGAADLAVTLVFVLFFRGADERRNERHNRRTRLGVKS